MDGKSTMCARFYTFLCFLFLFDFVLAARCAAFFSPRLSFFMRVSTLTMRPLRPDEDFGVTVLPKGGAEIEWNVQERERVRKRTV